MGSTMDKDPFRRAHTRDCFDLRIKLFDKGGLNVRVRVRVR